MSATGTRPRTAAATLPATAPERRRRRSRGRRFVLVTVLALVWVFPLYWMVVTALSPRADLAAGDVGLVPTTLDGGGFHRALVDFPVLQWTANSAAIAVVAVVITVVVDVMIRRSSLGERAGWASVPVAAC